MSHALEALALTGIVVALFIVGSWLGLVAIDWIRKRLTRDITQ